MKIKDGLFLEPNAYGQIIIPDCGRDDLAKYFVEKGYQTGVEIGVYRGQYTKVLCKAGLKIYGVDPWQIFDDYHSDQPQSRQDEIYKEAQHRLSRHDCTLIKKTSMDAIKDFEDESIDFVYIDGNHSFKYVAEDICEWTKKVRVGGIISGHDYARFYSDQNVHVREVVDAYVLSQGIKKWYVLGNTKRKTKYEIRDRFRSWFWFKE